MAELVKEVKIIATDVKSAFKILDERRGRQQVWAILRGAFLLLFGIVLTWWLTYDADKRNAVMLRRQADIAAEAARQIKAVGDKSAEDVKQLGKELEQGGRGR